MTTSYLIYLILFALATGMCLFLKHYLRAFRWFGYTLLFLALTEIAAVYFNRINQGTGFPMYVIYHISLPLFVILMYNFYKAFIHETIIRKIVLSLIVANSLLALYLSFFFYEINTFPGIQFNSMGVIMIGINLYVLLTLEPIPRVPIYKHPLTWICLGYIIFFTANFFLNGIYNKLVESSSPYRLMVHTIINRYFNLFLYACIIMGLWFSNRLAKQLPSKN